MLSISPTSGKVAISETRWEFGPGLTLTDFEASEAVKSAEQISKISNQYQLRTRLENGLSCGLVLMFEQALLREIVLGLSETDLTWSDWSKEREAQRKKLHDDFLVEQFGSQPYQFDWGRVVSALDPHDQSARIVVRYDRQRAKPQSGRSS